MSANLLSKNYIWPMAILLMVMLAVTMYLHDRLTQLESELVLRPPIVTVDFMAMAQSLPTDSTEKETEAYMQRLNDAIVNLKAEGYLVLDAGYIVGAPADLSIPTEAVLNLEKE